jgi:hypothetical protein
MAAPTPLFSGRVQDGQLTLNAPAAYARHLGTLEGQWVEVVVRKRRTRRSNAQNRWWWGVAIRMIADEYGYDLHDDDALHHALVAKCFGAKTDVYGLTLPERRSSKLTTAEFSALMEWVVRWAATELGMRIPLPDECDFESEGDEDGPAVSQA